MSKEVCHIGFSQLHELYEQHVEETDSALVRSMEVREASGMAGEPLPYLMRADWPVSCVTLCCFFLIIYAVRNGRKYLYQHFKDFFRQKDRAGLFDDSSNSDFRYTLALSCVFTVSAGIFIFDYFTETNPRLLHTLPHTWLLGIYLGSMFALVSIKWISYRFINWIFFEREQNKRWITAYFDLLGGCGLILYSAALLAVYLDLNAYISYTIVLSIAACSKILLFYKSFRNFFKHFHGILHLILYFCALEIAPLLFLWKGLGYVNDLLILNF